MPSPFLLPMLKLCMRTPFDKKMMLLKDDDLKGLIPKNKFVEYCILGYNIPRCALFIARFDKCNVVGHPGILCIQKTCIMCTTNDSAATVGEVH